MKDDTGNAAVIVKGMAVLLALAFGLCAAVPPVRAKEPEEKKAEQSAAWSGLSSRGSLVYQEGKRKAAVYAADFLFLNGKLATMPEETFDPVRYTHTHQWEYRDVNEKTHTKHCGICGDAFDLESVHSVSHEEDYTIRHEGVEYPGRRYRCVCGWQWEREASHVIVFEAADEINHRSRCLLENTVFCRGYESVMEEHYAYRYDPCGDGTHHRKSCIDCGFQGETEECSFTLEAKPEDGDDRDTDFLYCMCGNGRAAETEGDQNGTDASGAGGPDSTDGSEEPSDVPAKEEPGETAGEEPEESLDKPGVETEADMPEESPEEPDGELPEIKAPQETAAAEEDILPHAFITAQKK